MLGFTPPAALPPRGSACDTNRIGGWVGVKAGMNVRGWEEYLAPTGNLTRMVLAGCRSKRKIFLEQIMEHLRHFVYCARFCALSASWLMWCRRIGPGLEPQAPWSFSEERTGMWTSEGTCGYGGRETWSSQQLGCDVTRLTCVRKVACSTLGRSTEYS
jgi:hypothetical protein